MRFSRNIVNLEFPTLSLFDLYIKNKQHTYPRRNENRWTREINMNIEVLGKIGLIILQIFVANRERINYLSNPFDQGYLAIIIQVLSCVSVDRIDDPPSP